MILPGFSAETSLYKTGIPYRLMEASSRANGVTFQQISHPAYRCGPCYTDINGQCKHDCGYCVLFSTVQCYHWTEECPCIDPTVYGDGCPTPPYNCCCGPDGRQTCRC
jgi:hypothetical protein